MGDWTEQEIEAFSRRAERFTKAGMSEMEAETLAQTMLYRDRPGSGDDRRLCMECKGFKKGACTTPRRAGMRAEWNVLQRCDAFSMRGGK